MTTILSSPGEAQNPRIADDEEAPPLVNSDGGGTTQSKAEIQVNLTLMDDVNQDSLIHAATDHSLIIQSPIHVEVNLKRKASDMILNQKQSGFKRCYTRTELEELRFVNLEEQRRVWKRVCLRLGSFVSHLAKTGSQGEFDQQIAVVDMSEKELGNLSGDVQVVNENETKRRYSRNQMECLRFVNLEEQQRLWSEVYVRLGPSVAKEYDGTTDNKPQKQQKKKKSGKKKQNNHISDGEGCSQEFDHFREETTLHLPGSSSAKGEVSDGRITVNECNEDIGNESEDEFDSIQKPAFLVEGDPDFDSGPPQDGWEYLRRVRWETSQIPKVKVAKLEKINLKADQSPYMPIIPDIAKCPEHLLPSKLWEDAFLTDFTELRLALARLDSLNIQKSDYLQKQFNIKEDNSKFFSGDPMLSTILGMDVVSRTSALKSHIRSFEDTSTLTRNVCTWLYALCAVVDTPLDADTGASLRCLLRKCAKLRSEKSDCDDEVMMLNILVTISGKYFGQSES